MPGVDEEGLPVWQLVDNNSGQDNYAWTTQGPVTPRWTEHLGESDKGIILYRRLLREQMQIVEDGGDPMNTFRDATKNVSIHVPTETDDPNFEGLTGRRVNEQIAAGAVSTGASGKYSPINQQRAKEAGFAVPDAGVDAEKLVRAWGYITPREP